MNGRPEDAWTLVYDGFEPSGEGLREALCTLGNGRFATRGATPDGAPRTPGTYLAGCYDRLDSVVAGHTVTNEDIVNLPDWLPLTFATPGSDWFAPERADLPLYRHVLDLRRGVLVRELRWRDGEGRVTRVRQCRLVSMADPYLAAMRTTFTAENWSGPLRVRATLEGRVRNEGVARYRELRGDHLTGHATGSEDDLAWLTVSTRCSHVTVALAARIDTDPGGTSARPVLSTDHISSEHVLDLAEGVPAGLSKVVSLTSSRDPAAHDARSSALRHVRRAPPFEELLARHEAAWQRLWARARLDVDGPALSQAVHLHVFHLLQTLSPHTADLDAGVPARGLHGEAYRGHVFWDELFVQPWLDLRFPQISRGLLRYRWRRLPEARDAAREAGHAGAMFPWQSGSDGREETQTLHLNPKSGRWLPDHSRLQRHVGLAIAYNVWHHYLATGSMPPWCAELLLDIARFFASLAVPAGDRYEIRGVMGPDEYHDAYPGAATPGLDNNAYTNVMTAWLMARARDTAALAPDLAPTGDELAHWDDVGRRLRVDFHDGVISQFTGYGDLLELDWERYAGVRRLDRALEADGDDVNRYQASKQADTLMLRYLLTGDELIGLLRHLGYAAGPDLLSRTTSYYLRRTSHGSTLSAVVHAWVLARSNRAQSWRFFTEALYSDIKDVQGGTTAEGIHLGAMGGTLDLLQRCYLGLELRPDGMRLDPRMPDEVGLMSMPIRYRGRQLFIDADHHEARLSGTARRTYGRGEVIMAGTGDLGRRVIHHRERLGLSREQVAERADMSPGYLKYLEENADTPDTGALYRLADALGTTVQDLLGGGQDRPPGRGPAMAHPALETLDEQECRRLIAPGGIGRVAFNGSHGPTVLPVNYKVHEGAIVFRTAAGGAMDKDLRSGLEGVDIVIAFQIDNIDETNREGWSVLVQGPAHHVPPEEAAGVAGAGVTPWAGGERQLYIRIVPQHITGRRIHGS
ncbi:pyridoxamine 5'-phosphate oxidase family protein [Nonomuraea gerenzanensis]|uniref:Trehalose-6-phosphate phosphatase n=1 Tax=Nonomuraea gerenzanensis TaxID=93944 RepID=A0A1M4EET3_9ACTN|nr:pyridoxamine 5'-phosphate oxidase family protein [Nonomuraea gerenzanensis]UBU08861.1 pyridoxamine 5'-phosphate oxidase family protein [Nonomuraea gerenzanensis]SBO97226.1 Trehalose-6-phosphate phosphatase [Nonomuraea gerenzanensis]